MVITRDKLKLFSFYVNRFLSQSLFKRGTITIESEKPMYSSNNISSSTPVTTPVLTRNNFIRPDTINTQAGEQLIKAIKMERESRFKKINVLSLGFLTPISAFILYIIYRKKFLRGISPSLPDGIHFHMLIYKRLIKFVFGRDLLPHEKNYLTSPFLWIMELICFIPAVVFWHNTYALMFFSLCFVVFYTWLYFRIIKFKTPKFLRLRG